jgi:hypothetical protein
MAEAIKVKPITKMNWKKMSTGKNKNEKPI